MAAPPLLVGIECGGTHTVALAAHPPAPAPHPSRHPHGSHGSAPPLARITAGPCNLRLVPDAALAAHFKALRAALPRPDALGVGMAGIRDARDCARVASVLRSLWPGIPFRVDHDLESALAAAGPLPLDTPRIVVLSGTGSCCYGRHPGGRTAKVGGWGHHLGDRGSAHDISRTALRLTAARFDRHAAWGPFGRQILSTLGLEQPDDLIDWIQNASKTAVAALAPLVFDAARQRDPAARAAMDLALADLAGDAVHCARRLDRTGRPVRMFLAGSVLLQQPAFARRLAARIRQSLPRATVLPLPRESAWGAVAMAAQALTDAPGATPRPVGSVRPTRSSKPPIPQQGLPLDALLPVPLGPSPTERRNPRSTGLDRMPLDQAARLMLDEDQSVPKALQPHVPTLVRLIRRVVSALRAGGRLFYVGAGTSGRLGVLDASECPPTFRSPPGQVQGVLAGGLQALHTAVEGAEDDPGAGADALRQRGVRAGDVVLGIAAGGRTPFVWGALHAAREARAATALLCFNPHLRFARGRRPDIVLAVDVGPEVLTGSTRLKAGTATKLVLNILSTLTMTRLGRVRDNLMVDLNPSNTKLRDRAVRIVVELGATDPAHARVALEAAGWHVPTALRSLGA